MFKKINLQDFPEDKIYVLLDADIRKNLIFGALKRLKCSNFYTLSQQLNNLSEKYKINSKFNGGDIKYWILGKRKDARTNITHPKYMPLWMVIMLMKINSLTLDKLRNKIIAYRSGGSGGIIHSPKLPIDVTPELESIVIHLFCDGQAGNHTPAYFQKSKLNRSAFIKKLKNCFGDFNENVTEDKIQVRFPKAITDILTKYYDINSYFSKKARIPRAMLNRKNTMNKLACLTAFIVDEGYIRDVVSMCSINKTLLSQIRHMAESCCYICNPLRFEKQAGIHVFTISNKSLSKLNTDLLQLYKQFPTCGLHSKQDNFDYLVKRVSQGHFRKNTPLAVKLKRDLRGGLKTTTQLAKANFCSHAAINSALKQLGDRKNLGNNTTEKTVR